MALVLPLILVTLAFILLFAVIWIVIPPPNRTFWLWSIGVGEWSLWFGALALLCVAGAMADGALNGGWLWIVTSLAGAAVIAISLYPLFSVVPLARRYKTPLSLPRYFSGPPARDYFFPHSLDDISTHTFSSTNGQNLELDVYLPTIKNENNGASVIVVHGGSWNGGARSDFPRWNRWLAAHGFTVFDIDYTLRPQPNYLTAPADVRSAVRWVKERSAEFNIGPDRVALMGRSAGAHLAMLAAYSADRTAEKVRAVVSFYGPVDLLWAYDIRGNKKVHDGPMSLINFLGGRPNDSDELRARYVNASPISYVNENTPPTFLTHGGRDRLVWWKNMHRIGEKFELANVPHEIHFIPHGQHGFDYHINGWASQAVGALVLRFLARHTG